MKKKIPTHQGAIIAFGAYYSDQEHAMAAVLSNDYGKLTWFTTSGEQADNDTMQNFLDEQPVPWIELGTIRSDPDTVNDNEFTVPVFTPVHDDV